MPGRPTATRCRASAAGSLAAPTHCSTSTSMAPAPSGSPAPAGSPSALRCPPPPRWWLGAPRRRPPRVARQTRHSPRVFIAASSASPSWSLISCAPRPPPCPFSARRAGQHVDPGGALDPAASGWEGDYWAKAWRSWLRSREKSRSSAGAATIPEAGRQGGIVVSTQRFRPSSSGPWYTSIIKSVTLKVITHLECLLAALPLNIILCTCFRAQDLRSRGVCTTGKWASCGMLARRGLRWPPPRQPKKGAPSSARPGTRQRDRDPRRSAVAGLDFRTLEIAVRQRALSLAPCAVWSVEGRDEHGLAVRDQG